MVLSRFGGEGALGVCAARKLTQTRVAELLGISPRVYLDVSLDELAGRKETGPETRIHNPELHRLNQKIGQLTDLPLPASPPNAY